MTVYVLYLFLMKEFEETIGVYSSQEAAEKACDEYVRLSDRPGSIYLVEEAEFMGPGMIIFSSL